MSPGREYCMTFRNTPSLNLQGSSRTLEGNRPCLSRHEQRWRSVNDKFIPQKSSNILKNCICPLFFEIILTKEVNKSWFYFSPIMFKLTLKCEHTDSQLILNKMKTIKWPPSFLAYSQSYPSSKYLNQTLHLVSLLNNFVHLQARKWRKEKHSENARTTKWELKDSSAGHMKTDKSDVRDFSMCWVALESHQPGLDVWW